MFGVKLRGAFAATGAALGFLCVDEQQRRSSLARCAGWGSWFGFGGTAAPEFGGDPFSTKSGENFSGGGN